ncbi:hypothetical protein HMPREF9075_01696 [Capnocytophaga sp. oral taxon 332 str. F0381]|nr:hypothetical protein HMPREF9075_01696 [Capnocytophaga sp. oral taxon 332 str. F0381]
MAQSPPAGASLQLVPTPRWRKLAACAQFKIHNSKFIILPHSPPYLPLIFR